MAKVQMTVKEIMEVFEVSQSRAYSRLRELKAQELSCEVICDGQESYIEPEYYPEGFDSESREVYYSDSQSYFNSYVSQKEDAYEMFTRIGQMD